jgi:hypothetical protein
MADAKKPDKKPDKKPAGKPAPSEGQMVFNIIVVLMIIFIVVPTVLRFFGAGTSRQGSGYDEIVTGGVAESLSGVFNTFLAGLSFVSIFVCLLFILGIVYAKIRYSEVMSAYKAGHTPREAVSANPGIEQIRNAAPDPRWQEIEKHMQSPNVSDWRIAILESDIILYDMLDQMGYPGDSIGEKLKQADPSTFNTLQDAWKAHKIRNIIAHEGVNYELSRNEADRTIALYKKVFEEFYFI